MDCSVFIVLKLFVRHFLFLLNFVILCWQLIVVMASHCYLTGPSGELFVEYLVRHCALSDRDQYDHESSKVGFAFIVKTIEGLHPTFLWWKKLY